MAQDNDNVSEIFDQTHFSNKDNNFFTEWVAGGEDWSFRLRSRIIFCFAN